MASQGKSSEEAGLSRLSWLVMLCAVGLVWLLWSGGLLYFSRLAKDVDLQLQDTLTTHLRPTPERGDIVCFGIDEASLSLTAVGEDTLASSPVLPYMKERYPWNRRVWAAAVVFRRLPNV